MEEHAGKEPEFHLIPDPARRYKPVRRPRVVVYAEYYVSAAEWKRVVAMVGKG